VTKNTTTVAARAPASSDRRVGCSSTMSVHHALLRKTVTR
jgi:hypothetical protein